MGDTRKCSITVEGMTCQSCVSVIQDTLPVKCPNVRSVVVSYIYLGLFRLSCFFRLFRNMILSQFSVSRYIVALHVLFINGSIKNVHNTSVKFHLQ